MEEKKEGNESKSQIIMQIVALLTAAFGFVAALQWNNWVQAVMKPLTDKGKGQVWLLVIAVGVTVIAVLVAYFLGKMAGRAKQ
jgi:C4-dicarboxylate transporter